MGSDWFLNKWPERKQQYILDNWHSVSAKLGLSLKGWSWNWGSDQRKVTQDLLLKIKALDEEAERRNMSTREWQKRYEFKDELNKIYEAEELMWQKRGAETWLLKGDANTVYFHGIANGRKRKCTIK